VTYLIEQVLSIYGKDKLGVLTLFDTEDFTDMFSSLGSGGRSECLSLAVGGVK
jgi:hypothetical protein